MSDPVVVPEVIPNIPVAAVPDARYSSFFWIASSATSVFLYLTMQLFFDYPRVSFVVALILSLSGSSALLSQDYFISHVWSSLLFLWLYLYKEAPAFGLFVGLLSVSLFAFALGCPSGTEGALFLRRLAFMLCILGLGPFAILSRTYCVMTFIGVFIAIALSPGIGAALPVIWGPLFLSVLFFYRDRPGCPFLGGVFVAYMTVVSASQPKAWSIAYTVMCFIGGMMVGPDVFIVSALAFLALGSLQNEQIGPWIATAIFVALIGIIFGPYNTALAVGLWIFGQIVFEASKDVLRPHSTNLLAEGIKSGFVYDLWVDEEGRRKSTTWERIKEVMSSMPSRRSLKAD
jgi:hypothetical protein